MVICMKRYAIAGEMPGQCAEIRLRSGKNADSVRDVLGFRKVNALLLDRCACLGPLSFIP